MIADVAIIATRSSVPPPVTAPVATLFAYDTNEQRSQWRVLRPYAFTGTVKEVIFDLKPVHPEADKALHQRASVQAVGQGAAG